MSKEKLMKESEGTAIADRSVNKTLDGLTASATVDTNTGTPEVSVTTENLTGVKKLKFAFKNLKGQKGDKGSTGATGATGVGVSKVAAVTTSTADGGTSTYRITLTNGNTFDFNVKNGSKGSTGATGATGPKGADAPTGVYLSKNGTESLRFNGNGLGVFMNATFASSDSGGMWCRDCNNLTISSPTAYNASYDGEKGTGFEFTTCLGGILPTRNYTNLGSNSRRFGMLYLSGSVQSSDRKMKKDISSLSEDADLYNTIFDCIDFVKYRWKENNNLALETPSSRRFHYGAIAQDVEDIMHKHGISNLDNGFIHSDFFLDNATECYLIGGTRTRKDGYDYSQNVYDYKNGNEYEVCNEVIEKDFSEINDENRYRFRSEIQYILIQDISKVRKKGYQPPVKINSIGFIDKNDNFIPVELTTEGAVSCYDPDDKDFERPGSSGVINDDGSLTVQFEDMWTSYMIKIADDDNCIDFYDIKSLIIDTDYIGEYKIYLIPKGNYQTCDFWNDRDRVDDIVYNYSLNYQELTNMALSVLQNTRKELSQYKENTELEMKALRRDIQALKDVLNIE